MLRALEAAGFALVGVTAVSFMGLVPAVEPGMSPVFLACAAGALAVIIARNRIRARRDEQPGAAG
ncbi:MAG: hypothetical protein MPJ02_03985 [Nitrosopumilus sp.]|nr:hypothetical protein [Nitrosopumilus sp.]MDA7999630.1 hypothetical protein [Nitrosopumilus sp.]